MVAAILQAAGGRVGDEYGRFAGTGFGYATVITAAPAVRTRQAARRASRRERVGRQFATLQSTIERLTVRGQSSFWAALQSDVLARFRESRHIPEDVIEIFQPARWAGRFNAALRPSWTRAVYAGVQFEADWIDSREVRQAALAPFVQDIGPERELPSFVVDLSPAMQNRVRDFLRNREVGVWDKVGTTVHDRLRRALQRGIKEGDDFDAMSERIKGVLKGQADYASKRIARTEATGSLNFGQQIERDDIGIEKKEWVSRIDIRTRGVDPKDAFNHIAADGQVVLNAGVFVVSGQRMTHPCDGSHGATAGNICNCRCSAVSAFDDELTPATVDRGEPPPDYPIATASVEPLPDRYVGPGATLDQVIQSAILQQMDAEQRSGLTASRINAVRAALKTHHRDLESIRSEVATWDELHDKLQRSDKQAQKALAAWTEAKRKRDQFDRVSLTPKLAAQLDRADEAVERTWQRWLAVNTERDAIRATAGAQLKRALGLQDAAVFEVELRTAEPLIQESASRATQWLQGLIGSKHGPAVKVPVAQIAESRAYTSGGVVHLHPESPAVTAVHEIGHLIEHGTPQIAELTKGFLHHRGGVEQAIGFRTSRILKSRGFKVEDYDWTEIGVEDEFRKLFGDGSYYAGKWYAESTEIVSMGLEALFENPVRFARVDPEFFRFIVGILKGSLFE